ncbi:nucleotidyltransferase family protein [Haliovirga abyssi]|uniref:Nucleotidyltransferase n=1 Tax=Haliovirga abyssi TaxID=2996794 RepID=A0AAU9DGK3_9FUSO|nr:nucleotidyltransferase domain-containing protein [Haliovirga abyssi]BDU51617.1 nucleotidyltransferase [Haliovirga abyssi]
MTKEDILSKLREDYNVLGNKYGISKIGIFGSYATGNYNENSDIDILIKLKKPIGFKYFELIDFLEKELEKKVDIITEIGLNGIRVKDVEQTIKRSIIYV